MHIFPYRCVYIYTPNLKNKINLLKEIDKNKGKEQEERENMGRLWADMPTWPWRNIWVFYPDKFSHDPLSPPLCLTSHTWFTSSKNPSAEPKSMQMKPNKFWLVCLHVNGVYNVNFCALYLSQTLAACGKCTIWNILWKTKMPTNHYYIDSEKEEKKIK